MTAGDGYQPPPDPAVKSSFRWMDSSLLESLTGILSHHARSDSAAASET